MGTSCESSQASFPTRLTSALAGDVVVSEVVSVVAVPGTDTVPVFRTGDAPSVSVFDNVSRIRSPTACVVALDVASWLGGAAAVVVAI